MSRVPFASFDSGLFFYSAPRPSILPPLARVLTNCADGQEGSGPVGDPADICSLLHMWLDLTQTHRWEEEIPGGGTHSSAEDPLGGTDLGTADKTFSLHIDHDGVKAGGLVEYAVFPHVIHLVSNHLQTFATNYGM